MTIVTNSISTISVEHVSKSFGGHAVLTDLSFHLTPGSTTVLMGPNGSGKTTAMNLLLGLLTPDSGRIDLGGATFAAVFQEDRLCEHLSAVGNLRLTLSRRTPMSEIIDDLRRAGLDLSAMDAPVATLSGGQRRRVCIARALTAQASVLCLDEPFQGVYRPDRTTVLRYVRERAAGRPILLITHDLEEARWFEGTVVELPGRG